MRCLNLMRSFLGKFRTAQGYRGLAMLILHRSASRSPTAVRASRHHISPSSCLVMSTSMVRCSEIRLVEIKLDAFLLAPTTTRQRSGNCFPSNRARVRTPALAPSALCEVWHEGTGATKYTVAHRSVICEEESPRCAILLLNLPAVMVLGESNRLATSDQRLIRA
jgi:hypothetical protein